MQGSKLIELLKKLDEKEIRRFREFINSPYFNKNQSLSAFANVLLAEYPDFPNVNIGKVRIYKLIFKNEKFEEQKINDLMSYVVTALQNFLALENFFEYQLENKLYLLEALRKRDAGKEFLRISNQLQRHLEQAKKDQHYYHHMVRFENELEQYYLSRESRESDRNLQNKMDALDAYFFCAKLKAACEMINRQDIYSTRYDVPMLDVILKFIAENLHNFNHVPAIGIYYRTMQILSNPEDEESFFILKDLLEKNSDNFSKQELKEMYDYAQNYCIKKFNSGNSAYLLEMFNIYVKLIDTQLIYENGYLSQWDYKNIVSTALRLRFYEWTENFIHQHYQYIHSDFQQVAYSYNLATYHYEKKEYAKALKLLVNLDIIDAFYNVGARTIILKIYYEQDEEQSLRAAIDSFTLYLRRNKLLSEHQKTIHLNLLRYTKKLNNERQKIYMMRKKITPVSLLKLKQEIAANSRLANMTWLLNNIEVLESQLEPAEVSA
jgi:hypothetical protein